MAWLLDTNAWIVYLKTHQSPSLQAIRPSDIVLCSGVKAELLHGAEKYGNRERRHCPKEGNGIKTAKLGTII